MQISQKAQDVLRELLRNNAGTRVRVRLGKG